MKICFLIPVYNSCKFLGKLFYCLHRLDPKPDMTFFMENNSKDDTIGYIRRNYKLPYKMIRIWYKENAIKAEVNVYATIAHVRELLLTIARHYDPDYAIFLDDDVYPQDTDFITKITQWNEHIIGGAYMRVYPEGQFLASKWAVVTNPNKFAMKKKASKPFDMPAVTSGGCLCLSRKAIQDKRLYFYPLIDNIASEDYGFCLRARALGYRIILDNTATLHHDTRTTQDTKPWTRKKDGKYVDFKY